LTNVFGEFQFLLTLGGGAFFYCLDVSLMIGFLSPSELIGAAQSILVSPFIDTQPDSDYCQSYRANGTDNSGYRHSRDITVDEYR
jgi:hypothetical protein